MSWTREQIQFWTISLTIQTTAVKMRLAWWNTIVIGAKLTPFWMLTWTIWRMNWSSSIRGRVIQLEELPPRFRQSNKLRWDKRSWKLKRSKKWGRLSCKSLGLLGWSYTTDLYSMTHNFRSKICTDLSMKTLSSLQSLVLTIIELS